MSGSRMKWIAIVTMLIDHIGASLLEYYLRITDWSVMPAGVYDTVDFIDMILRCIGRLAFPIFIFLLIEGFYHTRSRTRYLLRLAAFCVISDIPFDLAVFVSNAKVRSGQFYTFAHQNVFFTLTIGFLGMMFLEKMHSRIRSKIIAVIGLIAVYIAFGAAAELLNTDYGAAGVTAILAAWTLKKYSLVKGKDMAVPQMLVIVAILTIMSSTSEICAIADTAFARRYNGSRGKTISKWFFYIFYPAHLFILFLIRYTIFP